MFPDINHIQFVATDDWSAGDWVRRIVTSPKGVDEDGSHGPSDEAFNAALFEHHLSEFLAGCRTCRLILGRSSKEWVVFTLFGQVLARFRLDDGRFVIEASEAIDIDRQDVAVGQHLDPAGMLQAGGKGVDREPRRRDRRLPGRPPSRSRHLQRRQDALRLSRGYRRRGSHGLHARHACESSPDYRPRADLGHDPC